MTDKSRGYPWLKWYTDMPDSPKLHMLTDAQKWRYVHLYCLAGKADAGGLIALDDVILNTVSLAYYLRIDTDTMQADLDAMIKAGLIEQEGKGYSIVSFMDEQGASAKEQREKWRQYQQTRRDKIKTLEENKEKEIDKEQNKNRQEVINASLMTNNNVVVDFLSLFSESELCQLPEGEPTEKQARFFTEAIREHGKEKALTFLSWIAKGAQSGNTWEFAYNTERKGKGIGQYEPPQKPEPKEQISGGGIKSQYDQWIHR